MIMNVIGQVFGFIGSLCLLLFGMNMLSDGIQKGAGNNLQKLLLKITGNRFSAVLTGIGVTAIIQSSGATTVMVVSFVNAEILTLEQAIGVIFGANIGTTVTAWIVSLFGFSFSISAAAIPLFGFGFILRYFKKFRIHNFAGCFMGFALLFMGLGLLKESLTFGPAAESVLQTINTWGIGGILLGVLIGAFITALIHSSSAMTAIVLTMAATGALSWQLSAAIVLGSNIGSTVDAVMSSFGASTNAKRTALVHVAFNVTGTLFALIIFNPFLQLIDLIVPGTPASNITTHIAMLHSIFNVCATLLFIPFVNQIAFLARRIIPETEKEQNKHYKMPAILPTSHLSADIYAFQIEKEITKMSIKIMDMFDSIVDTITNWNANTDGDEKLAQVNGMEAYVDEMNEAITNSLQLCSRLPSANRQNRVTFSKMISQTETLESLSDECSSIMYSMKKYLCNATTRPDSPQTIQVKDYLEMVQNFYEEVIVQTTFGFNDEQLLKYELLENQIDIMRHKLKRESRHRIENGNDAKAELAYIDLIRKIEKAGDCVYSLVQGA